MNFKANSPSPPLSVLSQAINTGRPSMANTSIWNNGLPPIVTDQEASCERKEKMEREKNDDKYVQKVRLKQSQYVFKKIVI